jgi:hypothetical protein
MDSLVNIILSPLAPLTTSVNLSLPMDTLLSTLPQHITTRLPFPNLSSTSLLIRHQGYLLHPTTTTSLTLTSLQNAPSDTIFFSLSLRLRGGKGGFGSQLRAQGGRMASRKRGPQDKSSCRDLSGRRLKAVQDAKDLAEYITKQPALEKKARDERRKKLEAVLAQDPMRGIKMDDNAYWEDKERLVDNVKNAVKEAVEGVRSQSGGSGRVEVVHTVSVKGGGVKREIKFSGFDEEYDDSSEEENEEDEGEGEDVEDEEDEYEGSTEEESPVVEGKGKGVAK